MDNSRKFGAQSTADDVIKGLDMTGKNVVITGGNSGIGAETALAFAKMNANVFVLCRDFAKGEEVKNDIVSKTNNNRLEVIPLDLGSLVSIDNCIKIWVEKDLPIHILINNAGVMAIPEYKATIDGFEMQFGVNHLGHFYLTTKLLPYVKLGAPSRIVHVSSTAHAMYSFDFEALNSKALYKTWNGDYKAYAFSKACNILFSNELNRRFVEEGVQVTSNALHPGVIPTDLTRSMGFVTSFLFQASAMIAGKTIAQGAATSVYCASAPELEGIGGNYYSNCQKAYTHGSVNQKNATLLWELSEKLLENRSKY